MSKRAKPPKLGTFTVDLCSVCGHVGDGTPHDCVLAITEEHRAQIRTQYLKARDREHDNGIAHLETDALCCGPDAVTRCAAIVGADFANALKSWCYDRLGCAAFADPVGESEARERHLRAIAELDRLVHE